MAQSKEMISRARQLRHDMTKEERHLCTIFCAFMSHGSHAKKS